MNKNVLDSRSKYIYEILETELQWLKKNKLTPDSPLYIIFNVN